MSGLLNGLIVTVTNITHATLLRLCEKWIKRLEQNTFGEFGHEGVQLRIAIHRGAYYWIPERSLIVGTPANVCSRLVRMAGPGQIVLSEDFISSWREDEGDDALLDIEPPLDKKPMGFSLVPGKISRFRIHPFNAGKRPSECLQQIHAVEEAIKQLLAEIEDDLIAAIAEEGCSIPRRTVHARVSLFVADKVNRPVARMVCTEIRHLRYKDASISGNESVTTYSIADRNRPHGPVGRAYVSRKVQVVSGLPPYSKQPKEYIKVMTKAPWNVPEETVRRFGRKARCFISIPFSLQADAETPEGVICIDTKDPLSHVPLENLRDHCEAIGDLYGPILAALLRLR